MKTQKTRSIIEQVLFISIINFLMFKEGLLTTTHWNAGIIIAFALFHLGTFFSLYVTITSKEISTEKDKLIFNFNFSVYLVFMCALLLNNFLFASEHLLLNYFLALFFLFLSTSFISNTNDSYKEYQNSLITNPKTI